MRVRHVFVLTLLGVGLAATCFAGLAAVRGQGTAADYERSASLENLARNKVFRVDVQADWHPTKPWLWYAIATGPGEREFVFVDAEQGKRRPAFDHRTLAQALSDRDGKSVPASDLPISELRFDDDGVCFLRAEGAWLRWNADAETLTEVKDEDLPPAPQRTRGRERGGPTGETSVRFVNATEGPVELFWDSGDGTLVSYGKLDAGVDRRQHTFVGHVWVVKNAEGKTLLRRPARADGRFRIGPSVDESKGSETPGELSAEADVDDVDSDEAPAEVSEPASNDWKPFLREHDVWVRDARSGEERRLTEDGTAEDPYQSRFFVSPDGSRLIALKRTQVDERLVHLIESSPKDQLQPRLHEMRYAKPGDEVEQTRPRLFDLEKLEPIAVDESAFANSWSVGDFAWAPDSSFCSCLYNQRGHQSLKVSKIDALSGEVSTMIDETSPTFVDYSQKTVFKRLDSTGEAIWASERSGFNHLYLYDQASGIAKNPITAGDWVMRRVERIDEEKRQVWFWAMGVHPGQDPYFEHYCRVDFDGSNLVALTQGDGTHQIEASPDGTLFLDRWSRLDQPTVTELRRTDDGSLVCELERGDATRLIETGVPLPTLFVAKGRDGETDIHGAIFFPSNFDPNGKYPVIEAIYAGPHDYFAPKSFRAVHGPQKLAELGFIVVKLDGMGTNWRSKAFHDVCWKNVGDSGFPDRVAWIRAAAAEHPAMDLSRVGIYGGSAGGQSALGALLTHGDFYKAAVADCGCHDNRMDKIWWNEAWMGWPIGTHYEEQSNVTQAHRLTGDLLLIVGELDRNVDPASTMQVVDALIRADKDFDLLIVPGAGHGIGSGPYGTRRTNDFFVRKLLGVEPRG
ncbi:MAG TPA: prolyl oligopeptidase family serine peptidase [Pirellulaceae bacterium]|jgi:dipeptidyl aminopeptidase/acylaminoacyl peptidase|nr:prolyl oligopeptidase family serine peptidase [Pirellulaceae bacterium]